MHTQVIATSLPPEEIEGIRRMFMEMDDDGSGTISFEELREGACVRGGCQTPVADTAAASPRPCCACSRLRPAVMHTCSPTLHHTGLRRKGAHIADGELQKLMSNVDLDGNMALDFEVMTRARRTPQQGACSRGTASCSGRCHAAGAPLIRWRNHM